MIEKKTNRMSEQQPQKAPEGEFQSVPEPPQLWRGPAHLINGHCLYPSEAFALCL
jgi:hypothetical protein